jgi:hypothetical protein
MNGIKNCEKQISGPSTARGAGPLFVPLALTLTISLACGPGVLAKKHTDTGSQSKAEAKAKKSTRDKDDNVGNAALDRETLSFINHGDWKEVNARLAKELSSAHGKGGSPHEQLMESYRRGWQAFAWMYQSQYADLKKEVESMSKDCFDLSLAKDDDQKRMVGNALVIKAFDQVGQGKFDQAQATIESAPEICSQDALYNFALAAVNGKQGHPTKAIQYSRRACEAQICLGLSHHRISGPENAQGQCRRRRCFGQCHKNRTTSG